MTTPEQTIADLIEARTDLSLVADVLSEADVLDTSRLAELLAPLASRNGFSRGDGKALLGELERLAHRDINSLAKVVSATPLASKIAEEYLKSFSLSALSDALMQGRQAATRHPPATPIGMSQGTSKQLAREIDRLFQCQASEHSIDHASENDKSEES